MRVFRADLYFASIYFLPQDLQALSVNCREIWGGTAPFKFGRPKNVQNLVRFMPTFDF